MIGEFRTRLQRGSSPGFLLWAAGEIFVVVAGVLIAFGLNAWWAERSARIEEQTHLRALVDDFEQNVGIYAKLLEREEGTVKSSLELLKLARTEPDAEVAIVWPLIDGVFSSLRFEPDLDTYQALVNSGGLTLIRDDELRSDLAGFAQRALNPYSERFADQLYMSFTTRFIGGLQYSGVVAQEASPPQAYGELLRDPVFQEHLAFRYLIERDVAADYRELLAEARDILEQLRAEIDN